MVTTDEVLIFFFNLFFLPNHSWKLKEQEHSIYCTVKRRAFIYSKHQYFTMMWTVLEPYEEALHLVTVIKVVQISGGFSPTRFFSLCVPLEFVIYCVESVDNIPTAQRLMSGPSSMPSGQAQVYFGEWSVIWGAFRQRYSQPPLGRLPMLQVSGAWRT